MYYPDRDPYNMHNRGYDDGYPGEPRGRDDGYPGEQRGRDNGYTGEPRGRDDVSRWSSRRRGDRRPTRVPFVQGDRYKAGPDRDHVYNGDMSEVRNTNHVSFVVRVRD